MMIKTLYVYGARAYNVRQHWNKDLYYIFVEFLSAYFEQELLMLSSLCTAPHHTTPHCTTPMPYNALCCMFSCLQCFYLFVTATKTCIENVACVDCTFFVET